MRKRLLLFLTLSLMLGGCNFQAFSDSESSKITEDVSSMEESSTISTDSESESSSKADGSESSSANDSSSESISYEADADGFKILEEDYFKNYSVGDDKETSLIRYCPSLPEEYTYKSMKLFIGDEKIPLYNCKTNFSQTWNGEAPQRMNNAVATLELKGKATFKLQTNFGLKKGCTIRPLSANVENEIDENRRVVTFTIDTPGQYTIEFASDRTLHLFVNSYDEFEQYKNESNLIYFGPGIHNASNSSYISSSNTINLSSGKTVFIDYGAIVQAKFSSTSCSNIKIVGGGYVDGSVFERSVANNTATIPYDFNYCNNVKFEGIVTTDPAGWTYNMYFCNGVDMKNIKIISSRSNGDGVSIQSCQNVNCYDSFVRSWDDSLVVKNYPKWSDRSVEGTTRNINFENCLIWTDLAQSMEIGYETVGQVMEDITFDNITVLHNYHKAPISIHNANNANLKGVKFTNITIEDASMGKGDGTNILIDIQNVFNSTWSTNHKITSLGSIDDVLISNVKVIESDNPIVRIKGCVDNREGYNNSIHMVTNVKVKDVFVSGEILTDKYANYETQYASGISFEESGNDITGADFERLDVSAYGTSYEVIKIS